MGWRRSDAGERGGTIALTAISVAVLFGMAALVIDVGHLYVQKARLQAAADSAATASAHMLPNPTAVRLEAHAYAAANDYGDQHYLHTSDIDLGHWDQNTRTFNTAGAPKNAVKVITRRAQSNNNVVQNMFAGLLGFGESDVAATAIALKQNAILDFEGLAEGYQPYTVSHGNGISGDPISGEILIGAFGGYGPMVFDSTCDYNYPIGCSGGDADLETPTTGSNQGGILINSEDGDAGDPDDLGGPCPTAALPPSPPASAHTLSDFASLNCTIAFDFHGFGGGLVTFESITLVDVEEDALVWLYRDGALVSTVVVQQAGDHQVAVRDVEGAPVADLMVVQFFGSGAVDDVGYSEVVSLVG